MANTNTTQILTNNARNAVMRFTSYTDGSTQENDTVVDATAVGPLAYTYNGQIVFPGVHLKVVRVRYDVHGMALRVQWNATTNEDILILTGFGKFDFKDIGGIQNPAAPGGVGLLGATGSIDFLTELQTITGQFPSYTVIMEMTKGGVAS